ncbi:MAG: DUF3667 domain-containing protein [Gemmatimonadaceae bacterium]
MSVPVAQSVACLNCGTPLAGPFCFTCGQRDIPPYPSTRELVVDAFWELSGWDGRFVSTVKALVQRPGLLTREFLEGRRARFLSPLRLYLLASLVYFVLAAAAPQVQLGNAKPSVSVTSTKVSGPERVANATSASLSKDTALSAAQKQAALKDIERAPGLMRPFLRKAVGDPKGFKRGVIEAMPKLLFALLPVFAGIVALFYRHRKYPEHLYFAIHLHAFVFLALCVSELSKFTRLAPLVGACAVIAFCWIVVYANLAFRRVYGGSLAGTLARQVAIGLLYGASSVVALVVMVYWVSLFG